MLIDSHQHAFWHGRTDADLVADMDAHGVHAAWLLTWEIPREEHSPSLHACLNPENVRPDGTHAGIGLRDQIRARDRFPERFVLGYCPDPRLGDAPALLEAAHRMHGARVCGEWKFRMTIDDPRCLELFRKAAELDMPVVLHLDVPYRPNESTGEIVYRADWYGGTVDNLERALVACPRTSFIGHAPGFWREISGDTDRDPAAYPTGPVAPGGRLPDLLDKHANLYADLSAGSALGALQRDEGFARNLLVTHSDRFLFGRDGYGDELLVWLRGLALPGEIWRAIACENALSLASAPSCRQS